MLPGYANQKPGRWYPKRLVDEPLTRSNLRHKSVDLRQAIFRRRLALCLLYSVAQCVETVTHATDTAKQFGINQSRHRLAGFFDDNWFTAILYLVVALA